MGGAICWCVLHAAGQGAPEPEAEVVKDNEYMGVMTRKTGTQLTYSAFLTVPPPRPPPPGPSACVMTRGIY